MLFPTKFVADAGTLTLDTNDTLDAQLTVGGTTVLSERYSPANGQIVVRGLRQVLEAAIYGQLQPGTQATARADVQLTVGGSTFGRTLYASRLRNPADPDGQKTVMAAGDLVAVASAGAFLTPVLYTAIESGGSVVTRQLTYNAATMGAGFTTLGDDVRLWVDHTSCPERCVCLRFLNRYDVPQTMMTVRPADVKPAFQDQAALYRGQRVRYSVEQQDEYTLRSARIHRYEEYRSWADLVTSRRAELLSDGQWLPIIVTKSNFTAAKRSQGMNPVEITFRMADPKQGL